MSANTIGIWNIRLMRSPDYAALDATHFDKQNQEVHNAFEDELSEAEAFLNNKLPDGFYVKIEA